MIFKLNSNLIKSKFYLNAKYINREIKVQTNELINDKCVHRLSLKTNRNLYNRKDLINKWYLRYGPKTGLEVNVECVDTKPNDRKSRTLVALHGCPGSHMDFTKLIQHFGQQYRVIVPNFPDFSVTDRTNHFWHSAEEKAEYVRDVLKALDVRQIDCLICHSAAIFPTSHLWLKDNELNNDLDIRSLCLLSNPGPKWFNLKGRFVSSIIVNLSRIRAIRQFLRKNWSKGMSKRLGLRNQIGDYDSLALLLSTFLLSQTQTIEKRLEKLIELQIPTVLVFSSKDKLFKEEIFYDLFRILKTNEQNFDVYEEHQNILIQKANDEHWLKVVDIRSGGHYVFSTHSPIVHKYIEQLLEKVN